MQKHRKWLVITIWISVIAFIGAGGIGWGTGSFGFNTDKAAEVGDIKISKRAYQMAYQRLYNEALQKFGGNFDEAQAKSMGLHVQALRDLIAYAQLESFAKHLGMAISDEEVLNALTQIAGFQVNGNFDKAMYEQYLDSVGMRKDEFEQDLRKELLVRRVYEELMHAIPQTSATERLSISVPLRIEDQFEFKVLRPKPASAIKVSESELKEYYEQNKQKYLEKEHYQIEYITFLQDNQSASTEEIAQYYERNASAYTNQDGDITPLDLLKDKIAREIKKDKAFVESKRNFSALRDNKIAGTIIDIQASDTLLELDPHTFLTPDDISSFKTIEENAVLAPLEQDNGYTLVKLIKKNAPKPQSFESIRELLKTEFIEQKQRDSLKEQAKNELTNFKGEVLNQYISPLTFQNLAAEKKFNDNLQKIGIEPLLLQDLLSQAFSSESKEGIYEANDGKIVLYRVISQTLNPNAQNVEQEVSTFKQSSFLRFFEQYLNKNYQPKIFIQLD